MKNLRVLMALFGLTSVAINSGLPARAVPAAAEKGSTPQLVIIDTDIGDDIDDAFALALALKSPELKVFGVTTTFGDTTMRARIVDRYLKAVGRRDIPVFAGPATKTDNVMTQAEYAKGDAKTKFSDGVEFILKTAREHPGQVTLIGIGPLFTVEAAIKRDATTFKKLKRVVIMGGSVYNGYGLDAQGKPKPAEPEWNILNDPAGLTALLSSGVPVFVMPLDSTQVPLKDKEREALFAHGSALARQLKALYQEWIAGTPNHSPTPTLFDPVAVTYTFRPEFCPMKPMHLDVDAKGMTIPGSGKPNSEVCLQSNERGFLELLQERIAGN
ncbi:MAG: nucleoside hydrolase [Acidobacteria bacterium]|nr:nucleoside hydrolase [Acidobacteriota bacterium]